MERERFGVGIQRIWSGVFALLIAGVAVMMVAFVARKLGEVEDVCAGGVNGMDVGGVCGEER